MIVFLKNIACCNNRLILSELAIIRFYIADHLLGNDIMKIDCIVFFVLLYSDMVTLTSWWHQLKYFTNTKINHYSIHSLLRL